MAEAKTDFSKDFVKKDKTQLLAEKRAKLRQLAKENRPFDLYFSALIFTVLVLAMTNPLNSDQRLLSILELESWVLLAGAGLFSLKQAGGFALAEFQRPLSRTMRILMWSLFAAGFGLLMAARIIAIIQMI